MNRAKRHLTESDNILSKRPHTECIPSPKEDFLISPPVVYNRTGTILVLGTGDTGQLGLGPDITERTRPAKFSPASIQSAGLNDELVENFIQICAGGMHTIALTSSGDVYTFGCNDEGALGRELPVNTDEPETRPGKVIFPNEVKIKMVSAGDSHSAALDHNGNVWLWGTFRGASGAIGLTKIDEISKIPLKLNPSYLQQQGRGIKASLNQRESKAIKISSGQDHLVILSDEGRLFSMGCGEQGQLGRIAERFCKDGGRSGLDHLLQPAECRIRGNIRFNDVWAGGFATFARCSITGSIYACGLNNYGQLSLLDCLPDSDKKLKSGSTSGNQASTEDVKMSESEAEADLMKTQGPLIQYMLTKAKGYSPLIVWKQLSISMHHTISLDIDGNIYAAGRREYGRLGLGKSTLKDSVVQPRKISFDHLIEKQNSDEKKPTTLPISWIGVGEACSFAVERAESGRCFAWGIGSNHQLAQGDANDDIFSPSVMQGKNLDNRRVVLADAGGQHSVLLAQLRDSKINDVRMNGIGNSKEVKNLHQDSTGDPKIPTNNLRSSPLSKPHDGDVSTN